MDAVHSLRQHYQTIVRPFDLLATYRKPSLSQNDLVSRRSRAEQVTTVGNISTASWPSIEAIINYGPGDGTNRTRSEVFVPDLKNHKLTVVSINNRAKYVRSMVCNRAQSMVATSIHKKVDNLHLIIMSATQNKKCTTKLLCSFENIEKKNNTVIALETLMFEPDQWFFFKLGPDYSQLEWQQNPPNASSNWFTTTTDSGRRTARGPSSCSDHFTATFDMGIPIEPLFFREVIYNKGFCSMYYF